MVCAANIRKETDIRSLTSKNVRAERERISV